MNNTKLDELLEDIFTNRGDVWDLTYRILLRKRKVGYEKEKLADTILKLR